MDNKKILLVEDDLDIQENLKFCMELEGYEVTLAHNGQEALNCLESGFKPFVILLDLMMPVMDGCEFLQQLRRTDSTVKFDKPIVLISAAADLEDTALAQSTLFLRKPFSLNVLFDVISGLKDKG